MIVWWRWVWTASMDMVSMSSNAFSSRRRSEMILMRSVVVCSSRICSKQNNKRTEILISLSIARFKWIKNLMKNIVGRVTLAVIKKEIPIVLHWRLTRHHMDDKSDNGTNHKFYYVSLKLPSIQLYSTGCLAMKQNDYMNGFLCKRFSIVHWLKLITFDRRENT